MSAVCFEGTKEGSAPVNARTLWTEKGFSGGLIY